MSRPKKIKHTRVSLTQILRALADQIEAGDADRELLLPTGNNVIEQLRMVRSECCGVFRFDPMEGFVTTLCLVRAELEGATA